MSVHGFLMRGDQAVPANPAPVPERSCGTCTLCCKLPRVVELAKSEGKWRPHCTPGKGCNIYPSRPTPTRPLQLLVMVKCGGSLFVVSPDRDIDVGFVADDEVIVTNENITPRGITVEVRKIKTRSSRGLRLNGLSRRLLQGPSLRNCEASRALSV